MILPLVTKRNLDERTDIPGYPLLMPADGQPGACELRNTSKQPGRRPVSQFCTHTVNDADRGSQPRCKLMPELGAARRT